MKRLFNKEEGQMLVETMIALAITVIGLLGLLNLLSNSVGINKVISDQYIGSYLAAEGIEVVKNIIDNNIASGQAFNSGISYTRYEIQYNSLALSLSQDRFIKFDETNKRYGYDAGAQTPFKRTIQIRAGASGDNELVVTSLVEWTTRGGLEQEVLLEDHFFNWRS